MLYTHFFWDFDGTLYDTYGRITRALMKGLADMGIQTDFDTAFHRVKKSLGEALNMYLSEHPEVRKTPDEAMLCYRAHSEEEDLSSIQPYADTRKVLEAVVQMGGKNYLYTHRGQSAIDALKRDELHPLFTDFVISTHGFPAKPAPDALNHLCEKHKLDKQACVMVGDRSIDLDAGKNAGMQGALYDPDHLYDHYETAHRFDTLAGLKNALIDQNKKGEGQMERVEERFLRYVKIDTTSLEDTGKCPSCENQRVLADMLAQELKEIGMQEVRVSEHGYVYAALPATPGCENEKVLGLIAHMDTSNAVPGGPVNARQFLYEGGDIVLNEEKHIVMGEKEFDLAPLKGQELIVTDGLTLLGADDKAGIAEIMAACEYLICHPEVKHGRVMVGFTPDEEIGAGADLFDVEGFGAEYAYTLDGAAIDEMEYENFNAASAVVKIKGNSIHPGSAKNKMINAATVGMQFHGMLPVRETPENTESYEGFAHLVEIQGETDHCVMKYIIRDHDMDLFNARKARFEKIAEYLNGVYGEGTVQVTLRDSYYNMKEKIMECPWVLDRAYKALESCGVHAHPVAIRGGTDGARLSFMGLPCPNLGTGGGNYHGVHEYLSVTQMRKMVEVIVKLVSVS
ncbi:MAG: peptidase T [Clostridiales bacterium]|nr:peptidase T [Clostridiales bacterium]